MRIIRTITVLLVILTLVGCATGFRYTRPNTTQQQVDKDGYECRREATYTAYNANVNPYYGAASSGNQVDMELAKQCLRARGYTITYG